MTKSSTQADLDYLFTSKAVRDRCQQIYAMIASGKSEHFQLNENLIDPCADYVVEVIKKNYPTLEIPFHSRWRHFSFGGVDRLYPLNKMMEDEDEQERARSYFDLVISSVLLDAGAGPDWSFTEPGSNRKYSRSEGLGVASYHMFVNGLFSDGKRLLVDGERLQVLTDHELATAFQISESNPMTGLSGRTQLLRSLGKLICDHPEHFGDPGRLGRFYDFVVSQSNRKSISAKVVLECVLKVFSPIWPNRLQLAGTNLGDVWHHAAATGQGETNGLVPFHKLSQWLTYSLLEPLMWSGIKVTDIDDLTGLPEYRNGGLFVDMDVLKPRDARALTIKHKPDSPFIVEWRAATVCLLDKMSELVRKRLGKRKEQFPLARVLEGGTWSAGRAIAKEKRPDGIPPINIDSDGTVF